MVRGALGASTQKRSVISDHTSAPGDWVRFPNFVLAPSPFNQARLCRLRIAHADTRKAARVGRRQPAFDLWSMVLGCPPPVPGVGARNDHIPGALVSIAQAHACFRGIQRPLAEDDDGSDVVVYVLRPHFFYEYDPNMVSVALKVPVPRGVLFATYARLVDSDNSATMTGLGTITHWGFLESDRADPRLPINFKSRYRTRLW
jgi:hypothetical protein